MMMQKYYGDILDATTGKVYEFKAAEHDMVLSVVKCEYTQNFPAVAAGFFNVASAAHTETIVGFIGGMLVDGTGADGFRITESNEDGAILECKINGKYHSCVLPDEIASKLSTDGNMPIYTENWDDIK